MYSLESMNKQTFKLYTQASVSTSFVQEQQNIRQLSTRFLPSFRESLRHYEVEKCKAILAKSHSEPITTDYQRPSANVRTEPFWLHITFNNCGGGEEGKEVSPVHPPENDWLRTPSSSEELKDSSDEAGCFQKEKKKLHKQAEKVSLSTAIKRQLFKTTFLLTSCQTQLLLSLLGSYIRV